MTTSPEPQMSSLSAMSHVGQSSAAAQVATDPTHSQAMMMSQPPSHPVQPDNGPYISVHRTHEFGASAGSEGYSHHVMSYAVPQGPPPPPGGELMYASEPSGSHETLGSDSQGNPTSSPVASGSGGAASYKRKRHDSSAPEGSSKKKRQRAPAQGENGEGDDADLGPNGGPKHWTEDDKSRFFTWMLTSNEHWEAFRTRMNTVFRECSSELFPGRKSYTALKSCFHRNLDVFKQIHAFQNFSANRIRQLQAETPNAEQPPVDSLLDMARAAGLNVGTLNSKIIDKWYEAGWYDLFRRRYREDPKTGLLVPQYGSLDEGDAGPSDTSATPVSMGLLTRTSIDPQLVARRSAPEPLKSGSAQHAPSPEPSHPSSLLQHNGYSEAYAYPSPASQPSDQHHVGPSTSYSASPSYIRSVPTGIASPRVSLAPPTRSPDPTPAVSASRTQSDLSAPRDSLHPDYTSQTTQTLARLNVVTDALLEVCSTLRDLMQTQAEESRLRTELLRAETAQRSQNPATSTTVHVQEKDKEISIEKVTFATEILKNGPENEDIKKAAIECLTKYLMRGL